MVQPALLGGVAMGVLSALPFIQLANCCCAWILFGGGLAAYLMQQNRHTPISVGDGALVGLLAGVVGAIVWTVLAIPINALLLPMQTSILEQALANAQDMPPEVRSILEGMQGGAMMGAAAFAGFFIALCVCAFFGMIGGLFGALIFKKDAPPPPLPPPPTFGSGSFTPGSFTPPPPPLPPPPPPGQGTHRRSASNPRKGPCGASFAGVPSAVSSGPASGGAVILYGRLRRLASFVAPQAIEDV